MKTFVTKLVKDKETLFTIHAPPHVGHYKLEIFAAAVPKKRGKMVLPIIATFLVEVKLKAPKVVGMTTSTLKGSHKLASIAETIDMTSDSGSSYGMYPDSPGHGAECFSGLPYRGKADKSSF